MPRRKLNERNIRKIQQSRGMYSISIPIEYIRELGWKERQNVIVELDGKTLTVSDWEE